VEGIVLEEAVDLSSDRLLMMMMYLNNAIGRHRGFVESVVHAWFKALKINN
jgi:hypothetical protein